LYSPLQIAARPLSGLLMILNPAMLKSHMSFADFSFLRTIRYVVLAATLFAAFFVSGCASMPRNDIHALYEKSKVGTDRFASAGGYNVHYVEAGTGDPVILIPGAFSTYRLWTRLIPDLSHQFRVIAIDYPGVGDSDKPDSGFDYSVNSQADVLADLIRSLDLGKVSLAGVSYGSAIALNVAARYPGLVKNVVCIEGGALILPEQLHHSKSTALLGVPIIGDIFLEILKTGLFNKAAAIEVMGEAWEKLDTIERELVLKIVETNLKTASRTAWYRIYQAITAPTDFTQELIYSSVPIKYLYGEQSRYREVSRTNADIIRSIALNSEIIPFNDGIHDLELQYPGKVLEAIAGPWGNTEFASDMFTPRNR